MTAPASSRYLDPEFIARIPSLGLRARIVVEGFVSGLHRSPFFGANIEFAEHREYAPGDEIRSIDWRAYARTDKFHIKLYDEETNMRVFLMLDASGSMAYTGDPARMTKLEYAKSLAASLGYLALKQKDAAGLAVFRDELSAYLPASSRIPHFQDLLRTMEGIEAGQPTSIDACFQQMADRVRKRGCVVLISDLWDHPERILQGVFRLRHMKFDALVLHVLDPLERTLGMTTERIFRDLETGERLAINPRDLQPAYRKVIEERIRQFRFLFRENGVDYEVFDTSEPFATALRAYLRRRLGSG